MKTLTNGTTLIETDDLLDMYEQMILSAAEYRKEGNNKQADIDGRIATDIPRKLAKDNR